MKLHILGTGMGSAVDCYNTCFYIENNGQIFMVDAGGGNGIYQQVKKDGLSLNRVHDIFVTHAHTDHILGVIWIIRELARIIRFDLTYVGNCNVYADEVTMKVLNTLCDILFQSKIKIAVRERFNFIVVKDSEKRKIAGLDIKFFDIKANDGMQTGFTINGNKICFCGDEWLKEENFSVAKNCNWLLHEAFCLDTEKEMFKPHEKNHVTVKEAAEIAQKAGAKNLVLWHAEDSNLLNRKKLYIKEAKKYFNGNIFVPDDLDIIDLK